MIEDFIAFFDYYQSYSTQKGSRLKHESPMIKIEYPEISTDGKVLDVYLTPFSHAINTLCLRDYSDTDNRDYSQKDIARICHVTQPEVSLWRKQERIPKKYSWFLLLIDISYKAYENNSISTFVKRIIHPKTFDEAEHLCNVYLRMINTCYEPFCHDDYILLESFINKDDICQTLKRLKTMNPEYWNQW